MFERNMSKKNCVVGFLCVFLLVLSFAGTVNAGLTITTKVYGKDNLYHQNWGHPYGSAVGTGVAPSSVPLAFLSGQSLNLTATGCVVDRGPSCTGPDGDGSGMFRDNPVYSLIGIWSSDSVSINPVEDGSNPTFFIGSSANLVAPSTVGNLYLFLGENDGNFNDNPASRYYSVTIETDANTVPAPSAILLLGSGLAVMVRIKRRIV